MRHMTAFIPAFSLCISVLLGGCHAMVSSSDAEENMPETVSRITSTSTGFKAGTYMTATETTVEKVHTECQITAESTNKNTTGMMEIVTVTRQQTTATSTKNRTTTEKTAVTTQAMAPNKPEMLDTEAIADELLKLINKEREMLGILPVTTAPIAHEIATVRSKELQITWGHTRPDGTGSGTIYTIYRYGEQKGRMSIPDGSGGWIMVDAYSPGGTEDISGLSLEQTVTSPELIARAILYGQSDPMVSTYLPGLAGTGFKGSPHHWDDMMNPQYTGVGIGVSYSTSEMFYWVCTAVEMMRKTYG